MPRLLVLLVFVCSTSVSAQQTGGSFVNFESSPVHPVAVSADGSRLVAANTADGRLEVLSLLDPDHPHLLLTLPTGIDPVSLALNGNDEVWVVNAVSDSVVVVSIPERRVVDVLDVGDDPADVVFAGSPRRAFVSVAGRDEVKVFDVATHAFLATIPIPGKEPRALARDGGGGHVYSLVFRSGNRTTLVPFGLAPLPPLPWNPALPTAPVQSLVVSLDDPAWASHPMNMPDVDLVDIDAQTLAPVAVVPRLGTIHFDLAADPVTGRLFVVGTDARNAVRFEPVLRGHFIDNRMAILDSTNVAVTPPRVVDLNPDVDYSVLPNPAAQARALAEPVSVVVDAAGDRVYVAAQGSDRIGVFDRSGKPIGRIELSQASPSGRDTANKRGPRGLALHPFLPRLYVSNRLSATVSVVDTLAMTVISEFPLSFDPTPAPIKDGRRFLYEARLSGNGTASCAGCHVDGEHDLLAWDLGDPGGTMGLIPAQGGLASMPRSAFPAWPLHPMKGPMVTQTLRGLAGGAPFHWRGDRPRLQDFRGAFSSLLGGRLPSEAEMDRFAAFMERIAFPPNPHQNLDRSYDDVAARGRKTFESEDVILFPGGERVRCATCHAGVDGGDAHILVPTPSAFIGPTQPMNVPSLRGLWRRGQTNLIGLPTKVGFGFANDGMFPSLRSFLDLTTFNLLPLAKKDDLAHFLLSFDSGMAPLVGRQLRLDAQTAPLTIVDAAIAFAESRARAGDIDLVLLGQFDGLAHGLLYDPVQDLWVGDAAGFGPFPRALVLQAGTAGIATGFFMGVPPGSGRRVALDRDEDALLEGDGRLMLYGQPGAGPRGPVVLEGNLAPRLGESRFGLTVAALPPGATATLVLAALPAQTQVAGIPVYVDLGAGSPVVLPMTVDPSPAALIALPVPDLPALVGLDVYAQAFLTGPGPGPMILATNGLRVRFRP